MRYGFDRRTIAAQASLYSLDRSEKTKANLFESYIAGLYLSLQRQSQASRLPTPPRTPLDDNTLPPVAELLATQANTAVPQMDDGSAFVKVSTWLRAVFTPVAIFAFEEMKKEYAATTASSAEGDEAEMDRLSVGALAILNEHFIKFHARPPVYLALDKASVTDKWTVQATAVKKDGTE